MILKYIKGVVKLQYEESKCIGCGFCEMVCPHAVFSIVNKKAYISDVESCMECGACAKNCPASAINVESGVG